MARGVLPMPSAAELIGLRIGSVEPGRVRMALTPAEYHLQPDRLRAWRRDRHAARHGDGVAPRYPCCRRGRSCTTLEIKLNYLRALTESSGEVVARAVAVHTGRQVAVAEGRVSDAKGRVFATASTTLLVFDTPAEREPLQETPRERVVQWDDPRDVAKAAARMDGLDYLRAACARHGGRDRRSAPCSALQ